MDTLFVGPVAAAAVSAVLALLIAVTDRVVNDYGEVSIDINGGKKKLKVKGGAPLLSSLAAEGIFVPSACGGRGSCGACKCKVESDVGPHLPTELPYLSSEEVAANVRLSCQVKLKKDIAIRLPDELFSVRRLRGRVESLKDLTYDIKELYVALEGEIDFVAGQYVQLVVPPYPGFKGEAQRAYSMSSRPSDRGHVELLIRLVPGGIATTYVHKHLKEGDAVEVIGPFGEFRVHDTGAAMLCVAGGSGMAPFKSMLHHMRETGAFPEKEIWYFFGARSLRDMFYLDELRKLESEWPRFHFVPALSEPQPEDDWKGETGLITDVLDRWIKNRIDGSKGLEGYLCGSPGMIGACIKVMTQNGVAEKDIFFDKFA
jgi:Na+-transporting NADH:ubiquinone oxidoreductase subunit F